MVVNIVYSAICSTWYIEAMHKCLLTSWMNGNMKYSSEKWLWWEIPWTFYKKEEGLFLHSFAPGDLWFFSLGSLHQDLPVHLKSLHSFTVYTVLLKVRWPFLLQQQGSQWASTLSMMASSTPFRGHLFTRTSSSPLGVGTWPSGRKVSWYVAGNKEEWVCGLCYWERQWEQ